MPKLMTNGGTVAKTQQLPVWRGPCSDESQGGITQGLIGRWLVCRERFRLYVMEGLRGQEKFSHRLEYGNFFHAAEEHALAGKDWRAALDAHAAELMTKYPFDRDDIAKWHAVCAVQFPIYQAYWASHPRAATSKSLLQEREFRVAYQLPSGRIVYLRGKWDNVELDGGLWCGDHKTKGEIDQVAIVRQLQFDLQTMTYLVALSKFQHDQIEKPGADDDPWRCPLRGVRYNLVMRPMSSEDKISQHKATKNKPAETFGELMGRLAERIHEKRDKYFVRFDAEVTGDDVDRFRRECLDPVLESICDDYEWWSYCQELEISPFDSGRSAMTRAVEFPSHTTHHYRMPFGVAPLEFRADLDDMLATGSEMGLRRTANLFPELRGV